MLIDSQMLFSEKQAITSAVASDNYIDLGFTARNVGMGEPFYIVFFVDVAFTDTGSDSSLTVDLYGDSSTTFTPDAQMRLLTIPALAAAGSAYYVKVSPGFATDYRYLQLYYTPNNGNLTSGSVTAYVTKDIQAYTAFAKNYTIS